MRSTNDHDVLIVGAGPAGAHLALRLARAGWYVGLVDGQRFPRPKPCGEFLSPAALPYLDELGLLGEIRAAGATRLTGMRLFGHGVEASGTYRPIGGRPAPFGHGIALRREVLDTIAFEAAAAEPHVTTYCPLRVTRLLGDARSGVLGLRGRDEDGEERTLRARFTIGADGRQSVVARELGLRGRSSGPPRFALVARYRGVAPGTSGELHLTRGGYFAAAPVDGGQFTLNLVVEAEALPPGRANLAPFLDARVGFTPSLAARLAGATRLDPIRVVGPLETRVRRATFDGGALVGDAAGFVDPMTGEGLFLAMCSAAHLARTLDAALRTHRTDARVLRPYERARRREVSPRHGAARLLQRGLGKPRVERAVLTLLAQRPGLADLVVGIAGDYARPSALLNPLRWGRAVAG